ncbi:hypothetical protein Goshw_030310 [Gossypium schwendimanii]|uniref:RNase H type-1 domain-containing protein n=1 Tax=Gossypium schwendimanii TaxID=34291 RepID=A0A7J9M8M9_GOSSC|nr:hypothetical protein [Gossypium schwendimanii]
MAIPWKESWVQLNTNGAVKMETNNATSKRVLRDHEDNIEIVIVIQDSLKNSSNAALIMCIHQLLTNIGQWFLNYVPREENKDIDYITEMTFDKDEGLILFEEVSLEISFALN